LFSNPSPCPLSLSKGRGSAGKRGVKPLSINLVPLSFEGEGDKGGEVSKHCQGIDLQRKKIYIIYRG